MTKLHKISAVTFIAFVLILTVLFTVLPDKSYSEKEKRNLSGLPALSLTTLTDGSFMDGIEDYAADQFPCRNRWMQVKTFVSRALGENESQGVYACKGDTLMERFDAPDEANMAETLESIHAFSLRHPDSNYYFLLAPTAISLYPEKLPAYAPTENEESYRQNFLSGLSEDITAIDVYDRFTALKDSLQLYYRTDHHWTTAAAHEAYLEAREIMDFTDDTAFSGHVVCNSFYGSLTSESGFSVKTPDTLSVYFPDNADAETEDLYTVFYVDETRRSASLYETEKLVSDDPYQVFFGGNHPLMEINTVTDTDRSLLVIKDSYANCFIPFLLTGYSEITVLDPRYYYDDIDILMDSGRFTDVLFLYNASTLSEDTNLKTVLNNGQ